MTRHASLAEQLKALLEYRNRPEGPIETAKTNWRADISAVNDNNPEDLEGMHVERSRPIRPRLGEIMEAVKSGRIERNDAGQIVRIGNLRFSDGTQTERAYRFSADGKLVEYDARMPTGAMLGTSEKQERILGGDMVVSNAAYTEVYGGKHPGKVTRKDAGKRAAERPAPARSKAQMRAEIAALPDIPVKTCKTGLPWKPSNLRELFMGLEKGKKGESGSVAWEDVSTHIVEREVWAETLATLAKEDVADLDKAMTAGGLAEFGVKGHKRTKERRGKRRLRAINDNFIAAMKKSAA